MRMEHKQVDMNDDLVLTFKPKSPQVPYTPYKSFEPARAPSCPPSSISNLQTTRSMFEHHIQQTKRDQVLHSPRIVSQVRPNSTWKTRPKSDIYSDVHLEPGPEPEFCYAPKPTLARKKSLVETLEEDIERKLEIEPARIPPGGVRLIPSKRDSPRTVHAPEKRFSMPVELRPEPQLEPFPFTVPENTQQPKPVCGPPPTPSKFIKGTFSDTNYESDFSDYSYFEKKFKHVTPPCPKSMDPNNNQPLSNQMGTSKYDFSSMSLKQMIQNGSPIPLPTSTTPACAKSRPASGYFADTEDPTGGGYLSNTENHIYNQVRPRDPCLCVVISFIFCC